jgi:hypothetical protein
MTVPPTGARVVVVGSVNLDTTFGSPGCRRGARR